MTQVKANGLDIEFESFGRTNDPAVLLIGGVGEQLTQWRELLCEGLAAKGFRVIRFDSRDVGKSTHLTALGAPVIPQLMAKLMSGQKVELPYSLSDMAADAVGLLEALGVDRAHVVGRSMGGMIAQLVAVKDSALTKSLVSIMSTSGRRGLPPPKPEAMAAMTPPGDVSTLTREQQIEWTMTLHRTLGGSLHQAGDAELRAFVERQFDRVAYDSAAFQRLTAAWLAAEPRDEILKSVRAPTLVLHGADDPLIPAEHGRDTAACIPGAELVIVPGMGHNATTSEAVVREVYLKYIGDFLAGVEARAKAA